MGPMPSSRTISLTRCELMARAPEVHGPAERSRLCTPGATPRPGHTRRDAHESFVGVEILQVRLRLWNLLTILT
jgi:hypothetical protein